MKTKRVQRPRLEQSSKSNIIAAINPQAPFGEDWHMRIGSLTDGDFGLDLKDAKRLHKFLGRAISYLEAQKVRR